MLFRSHLLSTRQAHFAGRGVECSEQEVVSIHLQHTRRVPQPLAKHPREFAWKRGCHALTSDLFGPTELVQHRRLASVRVADKRHHREIIPLASLCPALHNSAQTLHSGNIPLSHSLRGHLPVLVALAADLLHLLLDLTNLSLEKPAVHLLASPRDRN